MSKFIKISLIVFVSLTILIGLFLGYLFAQREYEIKKLPRYYQELANQCREKEGFSCCMSSVRNMAKGNYEIKPETDCLEGLRVNTLKCADSYVWCEPLAPIIEIKEGDKTKNSKNNNLPQEIFKYWVHSDEEDAGNFRVFRPSDYNFLPSRIGRERFEIKKDGKFIKYSIGHDDRLVGIHGYWESKTENEITVYLENLPSYIIHIISLNNDVLKIKK